MSEYLGRKFHRRSALDAGRTEAEQKLKEETKGQTLGEWFNREKRKPAPQAEDAFSGSVAARINGYKIIEGSGVNGGQWLVEGHGERQTYNNRHDAEEHARQAEE